MSLGSVQEPKLLWPPAQCGACRRIWGRRLDHQLPSLPEQGGQPITRRETWKLEVTEGNREEMGDRQRWYISSGTVDTGTREIEVPGDTWRREGMGHVNPDSDSLWTR